MHLTNEYLRGDQLLGCPNSILMDSSFRGLCSVNPCVMLQLISAIKLFIQKGKEPPRKLYMRVRYPESLDFHTDLDKTLYTYVRLGQLEIYNDVRAIL